ncbi:MAG: hypothetical protein ABFC62_11615 [Clostridiaceae bacterium]
MNSIGVEAALFKHQLHRHCQNNDLRLGLALSHRVKQRKRNVGYRAEAQTNPAREPTDRTADNTTISR